MDILFCRFNNWINIMKTIWKNFFGAYEVKDIGRNDPCLCGSLMKFKYCCIDKADKPILRAQGKKKMIPFMEALHRQIIGDPKWRKPLKK